MAEQSNGVKIDLDVLGVKDLTLKLLGPAAESAGKTLQDAWELVFGGFGTYVEKKRITRRKNLEDFKASLEGQVNSIPGKYLCEPPLSIIGPALEAAKYYFEEEQIREMFANTISASMDSRKAFRVHPSFPVIIQQMSSLDAKNLECFYRAHGTLPLCEYRICKKDGENDDYPSLLPQRTLQTNIFLSNPQARDIKQNATSISSLSRLGLISTNFDMNLNEDHYKIFEETPEYLSLLEQYKDDTERFPYIQEGISNLTPLGDNLCAICFGSENQ